MKVDGYEYPYVSIKVSYKVEILARYLILQLYRCSKVHIETNFTDKTTKG